MVSVIDSAKLLSELDKDNITIATVCSHSSLQIFHGAKLEGFKTLGIAVGPPPKYYDAFPLAKPDDFLSIEKYSDLANLSDELRKRNCVVVPHGSVVQYLGVDAFEEWNVLTFGNRLALRWESDRNLERKWLEGAGLKMPNEILDANDISGPVLVKYHGASGGRGYFIARSVAEFEENIEEGVKFTIQEYVLGTRYYVHYFYTPFSNDGYTVHNGNLEMLSADRRDESNIDEIYKLGSQEKLKSVGMYPSFVVTGNIPVILRESLVPRVLEMGANAIKGSFEKFGGMVGAFCLETVVTDQLDIRVFEISARIVAGTNPFPSGSPYSDFVAPQLSTGRRIAQELKRGIELDRLDEILS